MLLKIWYPTPLNEDWKHGGFGIYIHWPFCEAKCPYCDFNSHVARFIDHDQWRQAYVAEIDRYADEFPDRIVSSIFFGGGTPSLMLPSTVEAVINQISKRWRIANDIEITLEANPSSVEAASFNEFRLAGVNRVSLGVQALNNGDLQRLGRLHSVDEALSALDIAQNCFDRASFDLIYARQGQSLESWENELNQALTLRFSHFSLYQLTIEDGTAFGDRYKQGKLRNLPNEDLSADMYQSTLEICASAGLNRYETSNFAMVGEESRHNQIYWRYGDYLGIGPGAHGRISTAGNIRMAVEGTKRPDLWLNQAVSGSGQEVRTAVSQSAQGVELLLMGLRLKEGILEDRYSSLTGRGLSTSGLQELLETGAIERENGILRVTEEYGALLDSVIEKLLPG